MQNLLFLTIQEPACHSHHTESAVNHWTDKSSVAILSSLLVEANSSYLYYCLSLGKLALVEAEKGNLHHSVWTSRYAPVNHMVVYILGTGSCILCIAGHSKIGIFDICRKEQTIAMSPPNSICWPFPQTRPCQQALMSVHGFETSV